MKHWCAPWKVLLVTAMACQLTGCSRLSQTVARWSGKDVDSKIAAAEKDSKTSAKSDSMSESKKSLPRKDSTEARIAAADKALNDALGTKPEAKSPARSSAAVAKAPTKTRTISDQTKVAASTKSNASGWDEDPFLVDADRNKSWSSVDTGKTTKSAVAKTSTERRAEAVEDPFLADDWSFAEAARHQAVDEAAKDLKAEEIQEVSHSTSKEEMDLLVEAEKSLGALDRKLAAAQTKAQEVSETTIVRLIPDDPEPAATVRKDTARSGFAATSRSTLPASKTDQKPVITPAAARKPVIASETSAKLRSWADRGQQSLDLLTLCPQATGQVRELVRSLETRDVEQVKKATNELGRLGSQSLAAAPALRQLLQHADGLVRINAALALTRMEGSTPQTIGTLIESLKDEDSSVRSYAAAVLSDLGPQAEQAIPALAEALKDPNAYVRLHVAEVLIRHEEWSQPALKTLLSCLEDQDAKVRWLTTYSLAELAPQSQETVNALRLALRDPEDKVRVGAIYALGELGPMSLPAENDLRRLIQDSNVEIRTTAEQSLRQIHRG